ncbi:putative Glutamic acid alanine rich protein of Trypanosoma [Trypanosoma vivax]|nr:putative Glutamic acid alanine rich protein of Trypanosoma [Trypanosoma vivax]
MMVRTCALRIACALVVALLCARAGASSNTAMCDTTIMSGDEGLLHMARLFGAINGTFVSLVARAEVLVRDATEAVQACKEQKRVVENMRNRHSADSIGADVDSAVREATAVLKEAEDVLNTAAYSRAYVAKQMDFYKRINEYIPSINESYRERLTIYWRLELARVRTEAGPGAPPVRPAVVRLLEYAREIPTLDRSNVMQWGGGAMESLENATQDFSSIARMALCPIITGRIDMMESVMTDAEKWRLWGAHGEKKNRWIEKEVSRTLNSINGNLLLGMRAEFDNTTKRFPRAFSGLGALADTTGSVSEKVHAAKREDYCQAVSHVGGLRRHLGVLNDSVMKAALETSEAKEMLDAATGGALQSKHRAAIAEARAEEALSNAQLGAAGAAGARAAAVNTTVARGTAEDAVQSSVKAVQAATKAREAAAAAVKSATEAQHAATRARNTYTRAKFVQEAIAKSLDGLADRLTTVEGMLNDSARELSGGQPDVRAKECAHSAVNTKPEKWETGFQYSFGDIPHAEEMEEQLRGMIAGAKQVQKLNDTRRDIENVVANTKDVLALAGASNEYTQQARKGAEQSRQDAQLAEEKATEAHRQHALEKVAATCELMRQLHGVSADLLPVKEQTLAHLDRASSAQDRAREAMRIASGVTGGGAALAGEAAEAASAAEEHADRAEASGNDTAAAADAEQGNIARHLAALSDTVAGAVADAGEPVPDTSTCGEAAANVTRESMAAAVALYAGFAGPNESAVGAGDAARAVDERDRLRAVSRDVGESAARAEERAGVAMASATAARNLREGLVGKVAATCELMRQLHGVSADLLPVKEQTLAHLDRASSAQDRAREAMRIASGVTGGGAALAGEAAEAASAAEEHADRAEASGNDTAAAADAEQGNIARHLAALSDTVAGAVADAGEPVPDTSTCGEAAANVTRESMAAAVALYAGFAGPNESAVGAGDAARAVDERDRLRAVSRDVGESAARAEERAGVAMASATAARNLREGLVGKVAATCELMRQLHGVSADLLPVKEQTLAHLDRASSAQDRAREAMRIASGVTGGGAALAGEAAEAASAAEEHADRAEASGNDTAAAADAEQGNIARHLAALSDTVAGAVADAGEPVPDTSTCGEAAANVTRGGADGAGRAGGRRW